MLASLWRWLALLARAGLGLQLLGRGGQGRGRETGQGRGALPPCSPNPAASVIKGQTIALIIAEKQPGLQNVNASNQGVLFEALNARLRAIGLNTIHPAVHHCARVARAEAEAILNNDPDAAMAASKKLGDRLLPAKGIISARSGANKMVRANDVSRGHHAHPHRRVGPDSSPQARASGQSWAGSDVTGAALSVLDDEADELVARLYSDFCARKTK